MGKIEDCFGTREEAQHYGLAGYEQPILRLSFEPASAGGDTGAETGLEYVEMQAMAGIVVSPALEEPEAENIPHPVIHIQPVSIASIAVAKSSKHVRQNTEYTTSTFEETRGLLIRRPLNDPELFKPVIQDMVKSAKGVLTVCRVQPIQEVMRELKRQRDVYPHARILHDLTKIALSNIW